VVCAGHGPSNMQRMRNYSLGIMPRHKSSCQNWDQSGHRALHICWIFDCCTCYFHWHSSMCTRHRSQHAHVDVVLILCRLCFSVAATMSCCYSLPIILAQLYINVLAVVLCLACLQSEAQECAFLLFIPLELFRSTQHRTML